MKKIDKLVIKAFIGPFVITLCVVTFIFLMQVITQYLPDLMGKNIAVIDYLKLFGFFSLRTIPVSLPLAVLISSLMTFGNLGEFFELTALKSTGISAWRTMRSVFIATIFITIFAFFFNDKVTPWSSLKAYSLLYDIKTAKATLNIREGIFYNDIPGLNIKVDKKYPDGRSLKNLVIYKHPISEYSAANREITLADSGQMYTINNQSHLVFELFKGNQYSESNPDGSSVSVSSDFVQTTQLARSSFDHYKMVVSLESFGVKRTDEGQFKYHWYMKDLNELTTISDSLGKKYELSKNDLFKNTKQYYNYAYRSETTPQTIVVKSGVWIDTLLKKSNKKFTKDDRKAILTSSVNQAKSIESYMKSSHGYLLEEEKRWLSYDLEKQHKFTQSIACLVMFLIGASLGTIIKKGGFGVPVLVSVLFFIISYIFTIQGDKWAKDAILPVVMGAWLSNAILAIVGLYFLNNALKDSRLFDKDVYIIFFEKLKARIGNRTLLKSVKVEGQD